MALRTGHGGMRPRKLECGGRVAECRWRPGGSAVALRAGMAEVALHVIRIHCLSEVGRMTSVTVGVLQLVIAVQMTLGAGYGLVRPCERECR